MTDMLVTDLGVPAVVRVTNLAEEPLLLYTIHGLYKFDPGVPRTVALALARMWFGDERSNEKIQAIHMPDGTTHFVSDRAQEVQRLRTFYGAYEHDSVWAENKPNVRVTDLDGDELIMVIHDEYGTSVNPARLVVADQQSVNEELRILREKVRALEAMRTEQPDQSIPRPVSERELPRDRPPKKGD